MNETANRLVPLALIPPGLVGAFVMMRHGVARSRVSIHLASLAIGVVLALSIRAIDAKRLQRVAPVAALVAIVFLFATLLGDGLLGVHRWLVLGPIWLHASSLAGSPLALLGAAAWWTRGARWQAAALIFVAQIVHALQPDAGQSTALAIAAIASLACSERSRALRVAGSVALAGSALPAWMRADPLPAVPSVEGITGLARELGLAWWASAIVSLGLVPFAMAAVVRGTDVNDAFARSTAIALTAYVTATVLVPAVGNFPVPVLGFGVSPMCGVAVCVGVVSAFGSR